MSTEFVTIKEAVEAYKGNFIGTVIKVGDLKSGTKNNRDWTMKVFTVEDATGSVDITCFGDETQFFKMGCKYEIFPWWKEKYEGKPNLGIGKYGQAHLIGTDEIGNKQTTMPDQPAVGHTPPTESKIPKTPVELNGKIHEHIITMLQIEEEVNKTFEDLKPKDANNGQKIGMYTRTIFNKMSKD